ncbi:hypothetical protein BIW11_01945 [Tropilaelaps mercedesae]|uniref:Uncharacterized protein n=1 Tax=Tropilaelaps mercedesae TaxID=418985 RepID=A0A1V9X5T2_9ACAR|nr:hypothetical protein BIW11_01945 [Tropilaelaps mercedesae]
MKFALVAAALAGAHARAIGGYGIGSHSYGRYRDAIAAAPAYGHGYGHVIAASVAKGAVAPVLTSSYTAERKHVFHVPFHVANVAPQLLTVTDMARELLSPPPSLGSRS